MGFSLADNGTCNFEEYTCEQPGKPLANAARMVGQAQISAPPDALRTHTRHRCLWEHLRYKQTMGYKFRRQHAVERFIVDFYCREARLIVEVDGPVHDYTQEEDALRQEFLESMGFRVIRFTNRTIFEDLDCVIDQIAEALREQKNPTPSPSP